MPVPALLPLIAPVRTRLARSLRGRVAGSEADARAEVIWRSAGPRWFRESDEIWRVHADAAMFVGGIRALLLQSLHPLAMAGVAGHSGYRGDPWGRLQRTSNFIATTTFGTVPHAEEVIAQVRAVHERVRGRAADGRRYHAADPHLLRWVHVAETDSFLACYQRYGDRRLSPAECDRYVAQTAVVATRLGVVDPPLTRAALADELVRFRPALAATPAARDAARFLLWSPPLPWGARPGYGLLAAGAVASLPGWARRELRLPAPWAGSAGAPAGRLAAAVIRWAMTDPAIAADRRSVAPPTVDHPAAQTR